MYKLILFVFFVVISVSVYAELIDGPSNIREKPNGKETILYNSKGDEIGKTIDPIKPVQSREVIYHKENAIFSCLIEGYTFKNNI
jgi:hypothetical protein